MLASSFALQKLNQSNHLFIRVFFSLRPFQRLALLFITHSRHLSVHAVGSAVEEEQRQLRQYEMHATQQLHAALDHAIDPTQHVWRSTDSDQHASTGDMNTWQLHK